MRGIRALREHEPAQAPAGEAQIIHAPLPPQVPKRKKLVAQPGLKNGEFDARPSSHGSTSRTDEGSTQNGEDGMDEETTCDPSVDGSSMDADYEVGLICAKRIEKDNG